MKHVKCDQNVVADCMSNTVFSLLDLPEIVEAQSKDEEIKS